MGSEPRSEAEIFEDLRKLAESPGYLHAFAGLCFRDDFVAYSGRMTSAHLERMFNPKRLIRTELSSMLGLIAQSDTDLTAPTDAEFSDYLERTDRLLGELHDAIAQPMRQLMADMQASPELASAPLAGAIFREPIFYGSESAYASQFRDFSVLRYASDDAWLIEQRGFSNAQAQSIARCARRKIVITVPGLSDQARRNVRIN